MNFLDQSIQNMYYLSSKSKSLVCTSASAAVKFFSKLNYFIFGYFDPTNIFFNNKNKYFLGWPNLYAGYNEYNATDTSGT